MNPIWIDHPDALREHQARRPRRIGVDTEFVRERTFWPVLALAQIATGEAILLLDMRAPGMPAALAEWLEDRDMIKVMHSPGEDLIAFGHTCHALPQPLFDTQQAAALCGLGAGLGYQKLVQAELGIELEKGETRSDWLKRPLSPAQCRYAAEDVLHLLELHERLAAKLESLGRSAWAEEDATRMLQQAADGEVERWPHRAVRPAQDFTAEAQARLLRLLRWRESAARSLDLPKNWVLDQPQALQLAAQPPEDFAALRRWLESTPKSPRKLAQPLWQALQTPLPDEDLMPPVRRDQDLDKQALKALQRTVADVATELDLPEGVLASRRWLESLLEHRQRGERTWPSGLRGWRQALLEPRFATLPGWNGPD
ncbi:ribonuclease D [Luteimonas sp. e5]